MRKLIGTLMLGAFIMSPAIILADDDDHHDRGRDRRYYDREHRDYHHWDNREDRAYHMYWEQNHREYRDWDHVNNRDKAAYWHWRHEHSDTVLQINIP